MPDQFEIEVSRGDFSLKLKGLNPVVQVGQYIADAIGIVGEPLGYVKDSLHNFRVHREKAAAAAMLRAKEIADEKGESINNVPPKILAPWIEGASFEDIDGENISELWARILAKAPVDFDSKVVAYMDILTRIGPEEALYFEKVCKHYRNVSHSDVDGGYQYYADKVNEAVERYYRKLLSIRSSKNMEIVQDIWKQFNQEMLESIDTNVFISRIEIQYDSINLRKENPASVKRGPYLVLNREGLLNENGLSTGTKGIRVKLDWIYVTDFGRLFASYLDL